MGRLDGQRALVTGASSGIGAAAAQLLAREGADVALLARGETGLQRVAGRVRQEGRDAHVLCADVADRVALDASVAEAVRQLGGLDVVVVAAAAGAFGRFDEIPPEDFERCVRVTLGGAVDTIRAVLPELERTAGRLVVVGSAVDEIELPLLSPYVAAKHGLHGFLNSLRADLRSSGSAVRLSEVRPGAVDTPFWLHLTHRDGLVPPTLPPLTAYTAESVARAVVACAIAPRRSITVGGSTLLLSFAERHARPLMERALALVGRLARARAHPDRAPSGLWGSSGEGILEGHLHGRPSLLAALQLRGTRALDAAAVALGRGLVAGVAATAAMTVASTVEMRVRGREPSTAPAKVAGKLLGVEPRGRADDRFATVAHLAAGVSLGASRGLLDLAGIRGAAAPAAFFAIAWTPELVAVPAAGASPPPWRWGAVELAISAAHHVAYAAAGEGVYRALAGDA